MLCASFCYLVRRKRIACWPFGVAQEALNPMACPGKMRSLFHHQPIQDARHEH
jgi:hypothetical protein